MNSLHPSFPISLSVYLRRVAFPSYHRLCPRHPLRLSTRSPRLALRNLSDSLFPAICLCLPYFRDTFQYEHLARVAHSPRFVSLRLAPHSASLTSHRTTTLFSISLSLFLSRASVSATLVAFHNRCNEALAKWRVSRARAFSHPIRESSISTLLFSHEMSATMHPPRMFLFYSCLCHNLRLSSLTYPVSPGLRVLPGDYLLHFSPLSSSLAFSNVRAFSRSPHAHGFFSDLPFSPFTFPIFFLILLAAPCFLNLSIGHPPSLLPWYILRERDPTLSSLFLLTNPPRIFVSASELVLLSFSLLSFQPLFPGPFSSLSLYLSLYPSFSLFLLASVPFSSSRSCAGLFGLSPSHLLSLLRYDPSGRAAPLAARKKGGPKRTSYFLCSDSDLGGPKWPPMM